MDYRSRLGRDVVLSSQPDVLGRLHESDWPKQAGTQVLLFMPRTYHPPPFDHQGDTERAIVFFDNHNELLATEKAAKTIWSDPLRKYLPHCCGVVLCSLPVTKDGPIWRETALAFNRPVGKNLKGMLTAEPCNAIAFQSIKCSIESMCLDMGDHHCLLTSSDPASYNINMTGSDEVQLTTLSVKPGCTTLLDCECAQKNEATQKALIEACRSVYAE